MRFCSYSRQNLLSNKSNEELNVDQQQQYRQMQRQRARLSYFQSHGGPSSHGRSTSSGSCLPPPQRRHFLDSLQQHPQQQQQQQLQVPLHAAGGSSNNLNNSGGSGGAACSGGGRKRDWRDDAPLDHDDDLDVDDEESNENIMYRRRNRRRPQFAALRDEDTEHSNSSNLLNMNVNYGNSPLYQQRNKVPAKPTTSTVSLTPLQQRQLRFDFDLPTTQQYVPTSSGQYVLPDVPLDAPPTTYNLANTQETVTDESNVLEQSEETASEELNRNLLVNALKNDKFTTKFYESIKEDVYRRLEILFEQQQQQLQQQQSQQATREQQEQQINGMDLQPQQPPQQLYNEIRKTLNQGTTTSSLTNDRQENGLDNDNELSNAAAEATESRSETPLEMRLENDRPEDEEEQQQQQQQQQHIKASETNQMEHDQELGEAAAAAAAVPAINILEIHEEINASGVTIDSSSTTVDVTLQLTPDHELIEYIIKRIRNQTHNNTVINDSLLAEVSKLTATAAQNSAAHWVPNATSPLISPKRIYTKIKKMDMPRQRDEFLLWYRSYLEQLFVVEHPTTKCCKAKEKDNSSSSSNSRKQLNKRVRAQSQSQSQDSNNDADLAEADQKNQSSSNGGGGDVMDCENNENPEEEAGKGGSGGGDAAPGEVAEEDSVANRANGSVVLETVISTQDISLD
ncbi:uncharacterized protein Dwil_GK27156 [Drosophila willistoni]|uniref:Uncharacterized protein n=1 Tax=Drosophila willistoni TaxID=7260 RepID=A0A0Q9WNZ8_DROWI|nr:uncharacterized protein Dwil_GK27156 [Drosophila willistoni]